MMRFAVAWPFVIGLAILVGGASVATSGQDWPQYKFDGEHSGNAPEHHVPDRLGLAAAIPLSDAVFTSPAIADGSVYVLDGAGRLYCIDERTLEVKWEFAGEGGPFNCNNYSSPAVIGGYVHFGTMTGAYYVLRSEDGSVAARLDCGDPIFSCPVLGKDTVYFATLGSRIFALRPNGKVRWKWDFVHQVNRFHGDRWSGEAWARHKRGRVTWRDQFLCSRNMAVHGRTLVVPAGGTVLWLADEGDGARVLSSYSNTRESPATLGLSLDAEGTVYQQWFRRDNQGQIEVLRLLDGKVAASFVPGTQTSYAGPDSMSFSSVSVRGGDVYRCRPEQGLALCRHRNGKTVSLGGYPSIAAPILAGDKAITSGLDGKLYLAPLDGKTDPVVFETAFGRPITAPASVANGRVYFGCEDGYLYVLEEGGNAPLPDRSLKLERIRSPLTGRFTDERFDWDTHFGNQANTNRVIQDFGPPFAMRWIRRSEGSIKHLSTCGGGRIYTHTAEGMIQAAEQETGRLLWRTFYPGVHVSFTTPAYHAGRLLLPQAGLEECRLRCLDAATGKLIWEVPFTGSPSWNRQLPPLVYNGLVFYQFGTGQYDARGWLFEHQSTFRFPKDHRPLVRAWNLEDGSEAWTVDFSEYGSGGDDAGLCLMDGVLYYSCYFGARGEPGDKRRLGDHDAPGVTAAIEPKTGKLLWTNTHYAVHAGCAPSAHAGRLYLGGYNAVDGKTNHVWCLDAASGELIWESDPLHHAIHVVSIADGALFTHSQYERGCLLDPANGRKMSELDTAYRCTRFSMAGSCLLGPNVDVIDTSRGNKLLSSGPPVDVLQCVGAHVSNGRIFYTANGSGLELSMSYGEEAASFTVPWSVGSGP